MDKEQRAFQIDRRDNVATALLPLTPWETRLTGDAERGGLPAVEAVPQGHKMAVSDIPEGADILKYGVRIGRATRAIRAGEWVHLHNMRSVYDERSSHLDVQTGAPQDIRYE